MPRTAKTLAITHDGKDVLLAGPSVNLMEQRELVKKIRQANGGARVHADYAVLSYQESDGHETVYRFYTPTAHEARLKQVAADNQAQKEQELAHKSGAKQPNLPGGLPILDEVPEGDEEAALAEAAKSGDVRKDLLNKSRGDLLKIVEEMRKDGKEVNPPLLRTKVGIVDAIMTASGYKLNS